MGVRGNRHQVDQGEHEHPHQVNKVPVQAADFDIFVFELAARDALADDPQVNYAADHVGHVQPGDGEEGAAEKRDAPGIIEGGDVLFIDQVQPFVHVQDYERQSAAHGGEDPADGRLAVSVLHGV